jgi:hypothetical protein
MNLWIVHGTHIMSLYIDIWYYGVAYGVLRAGLYPVYFFVFYISKCTGG